MNILHEKKWRTYFQFIVVSYFCIKNQIKAKNIAIPKGDSPDS
jgi:hypothetical protein